MWDTYIQILGSSYGKNKFPVVICDCSLPQWALKYEDPNIRTQCEFVMVEKLRQIRQGRVRCNKGVRLACSAMEFGHILYNGITLAE